MTSSEIPLEFLDACISSQEANTVNVARHWQDKTQRSPNIPDTDRSYDAIPDTELEATLYYAGLPSRPLLVYRSGSTPWKMTLGPWYYPVMKELRPVFSHKIATVWGDLGPKVCSCLDTLRVTWTSIDVVRFAGMEVGLGETTPGPPGPTILWIGVMPQSLSSEDAHTAAVACLELLESYKITDVEVEFRESIFPGLPVLNFLNPVVIPTWVNSWVMRARTTQMLSVAFAVHLPLHSVYKLLPEPRHMLRAQEVSTS